MLDEYQINPAFDKNLVFAYQPPPEINIAKLPVLADDWLENLQKIICQSERKLPNNIFHKHLSDASYYRAKKILSNQLQLIYHRLQGNLDTELGKLSEDNRQALINKLTEEIIHCTEGFHNRVNIIVDSFHKPRNLAELLCTVRKDLIEEVADALTDEVHAWNRISVIAANDGLGVKANFPDDHYSGALSETTIRRALQQIFYKKFTPFNLPSLLITAFMEFIPELEIEKNNKDGLSMGMREKITRLIKRFLPAYINNISNDPNNWQKYFKIYRNKENPLIFSFVNIDWEKMYRSFFYALSDQKYFEKPQKKTLLDSAYYNLFLTKTSTHPPAEIISKLIQEEKYSELLEQLVELKARFPNHYQQVSKNKVFIKNSLGFMDYLTRQLKISNDYSIETMQGFQLLVCLDLSRKNFIIEKIADTLLLKNRAGFNPLMLGALNNPALVKDILAFLKRYETIITHHNPEIPKKIFLMKNKDNFNALMIAAMHQPDAVEILLAFIGKHIQDLDNSLLQEFFLEKQANNYNVLMLAASKQAEAIVTILNFLTTHIGSFANDTLRNLFTQQQKDSYTAVTLTARDHPDRLKNILSFITKYIKIDRESLRKLLFIESSSGTCPALMLSIKNQVDATYSILKFMTENIESFDSEILDKIFLEKDQDGFTILMLAARYQPKALEFILGFIHENIDFFPAKKLPAYFLDTNPDSYNCLMLAAEFQPISVPTILNFIYTQIENFKPNLITILFAKNKKGCHSLMLARHHPIAMTSIINFIHTQPKDVITITLEQIFLEKHNLGFTISMLTARDHANSLKIILEFIDKNPELFTRENLLQLILEKNELDYNSLMLAARNQCAGVSHILNFIQNQPEVFSSLFLNQLLLEHDKNRISTLMIATRYQPEALKFILDFIQNQPEIFSPSFLNQFLVAQDQYGTNALMVAATYQFKAVELLLNFLTHNIKHISNDTLQEFIFKKIHDKEAATAVLFGGRYNFKKTVLSVTAQHKDSTAIHALLKFIDEHIDLIGLKIFINLFKEKDNKDNPIFLNTCSNYFFPMKKILNFIATLPDFEALIPIQNLVADFIFEQLARWPVTADDESLFYKVTYNCSTFLLSYFNADRFNVYLDNLESVAKTLLCCLHSEFEHKKTKELNQYYFFRLFSSIEPELQAIEALEKTLYTESNKIIALKRLADKHPKFLKSKSILACLFAAFQKIEDLKAEEVCERNYENDSRKIQHAMLA